MSSKRNLPLKRKAEEDEELLERLAVPPLAPCSGDADAAADAHAAHQAMAAAAAAQAAHASHAQAQAKARSRAHSQVRTHSALAGADGKPVLPLPRMAQQAIPEQLAPVALAPAGKVHPAAADVALSTFPGKLATLQPGVGLSAAMGVRVSGGERAGDMNACDGDGEKGGGGSVGDGDGDDGGGDSDDGGGNGGNEGTRAEASSSLNFESPVVVLKQCRSVRSHLLSQPLEDISSSSTILRRTLWALDACVRQAELRLLSDRIKACFPPGSLTGWGDEVATARINEEIQKIDEAFKGLERLSEQQCLREGVFSTLIGRYEGENGATATASGSCDLRGSPTYGSKPGDKATLSARLRDAQFPRRYRAREFNRHGSIFRELRLTSTTSIRHQPMRGKKARNCALCKERETLYECRDCRVPLCTSQIRGFKDTCMAKWHEAIDLTEEERARAGTVKKKKKAGKEERNRRKREEDDEDDEREDGVALGGEGELRLRIIGRRDADEDEDDDIDGDDDDDIGSGDGDGSTHGHGDWDRYQSQTYQLKQV